VNIADFWEERRKNKSLIYVLLLTTFPLFPESSLLFWNFLEKIAKKQSGFSRPVFEV